MVLALDVKIAQAAGWRNHDSGAERQFRSQPEPVVYWACGHWDVNPAPFACLWRPRPRSLDSGEESEEEQLVHRVCT